jgi:NAD(P)-dependent dehydrogenase (short-subunit alcohol dehydrogenase family)
MFDLQGKVVLVTGGNSGIGLGFAHGVARAGADVVIWGRREAENSLAAEALRAHGHRVLSQRVDVADSAQVDLAMQEAVVAVGRVDGVIANAGAQLFHGSILDLPDSSWEDELAVNQSGAMYTLRAAARHMVGRAEDGDPGGSLLLCGSLAVVSGLPGRPTYVASKGALASLTRAMAVELGEHGIRVNMVAPGRIETKLAGRSEAEQEARRATMQERNPIRRMGTPADLEGIAVYLMSGASEYHTGDLIVIDGGLSIALL